MIAKIVHKIYWDFTNRAVQMKPKWKSYEEKMFQLYPSSSGYEYITWDKTMVHDLAKDILSPEQFKVFLIIPPIMQVDFARYAILFTHGGIYYDQDIMHERTIDSLITNENIKMLLFVEGLVAKHDMLYLGNAAMACQKGHPLMGTLLRKSIDKLTGWKDKSEWNDYDVLYGFGPHFLSHSIKSMYDVKKRTVSQIPMELIQLMYHANADEQVCQRVEEITKYDNGDGVYFLPPQTMLGCEEEHKGAFFGSHRTHGSWKSKFAVDKPDNEVISTSAASDTTSLDL